MGFKLKKLSEDASEMWPKTKSIRRAYGADYKCTFLESRLRLTESKFLELRLRDQAYRTHVLSDSLTLSSSRTTVKSVSTLLQLSMFSF